MYCLLVVDVKVGWVEVELGMVLDDLNDQLCLLGWFFVLEILIFMCCMIGGMVLMDVLGKGLWIYGKISDNVLGLEIVLLQGFLLSFVLMFGWVVLMLVWVEVVVWVGWVVFIVNMFWLNWCFMGYDLECVCFEVGGFEWWWLFLGVEGMLGLISCICVKLCCMFVEKWLLVVGIDSFVYVLVVVIFLLEVEFMVVEVMDECVQVLVEQVGILLCLFVVLQVGVGQCIVYIFVEFNGDDVVLLVGCVEQVCCIVVMLFGVGVIYVVVDLVEICELWVICLVGVGLLGKVDGCVWLVVFVEDCVVLLENLLVFVYDFLVVLIVYGLGFGIYGYVDVGCLYICLVLDIDVDVDCVKLVLVLDVVFVLMCKYGGIFWGEYGKGVCGVYLKGWIGFEVYVVLQVVKVVFDLQGCFNFGKLVSLCDDIMGIVLMLFCLFNVLEGDVLICVFCCNGNV